MPDCWLRILWNSFFFFLFLSFFYWRSPTSRRGESVGASSYFFCFFLLACWFWTKNFFGVDDFRLTKNFFLSNLLLYLYIWNNFFFFPPPPPGFCVQSLKCVSDLAHAVGPALIPHMEDLLVRDSFLFLFGLVSTLQLFVSCLPVHLRFGFLQLCFQWTPSFFLLPPSFFCCSFFFFFFIQTHKGANVCEWFERRIKFCVEWAWYSHSIVPSRKFSTYIDRPLCFNWLMTMNFIFPGSFLFCFSPSPSSFFFLFVCLLLLPYFLHTKTAPTRSCDAWDLSRVVWTQLLLSR